MGTSEKGRDGDVSSDSPPPMSLSPKRSSGKDNAGSKAQNNRKRTKTGCLTCRKRRIKCDEGKPICNNCIKSKRQCEGYNQRVIFKEPMNAFSSGFYGGPFYHAEPSGPGTQASQTSGPQQHSRTSAPGAPLAVIAPKPPYPGYKPYSFQHGGADFGSPGPSLPTTTAPSGSGVEYTADELRLPDPLAPHMPLVSPSSSGHPHSGHDSVSPPFPKPEDGFTSQYHESGEYQGQGSTASGPSTSILRFDDQAQTSPTYMGKIESTGIIPPPTEEEYWYSDDEASMPDSDDDLALERQQMHLDSNDLGALIADQLDILPESRGTHIRSFTPFNSSTTIQTYQPSFLDTPLKDSQTAMVFWYFVNATGPSMSLYERHPFDPAPMFHGAPVPKARQHIWTYRFPIIALNHPALLQAILALGSLQMANLQGEPATASMKHYHLALRRLAKNYQSPNRRTQPATLAATLLLGFYEIWNSDHEKWCKHMWGARAIIKDIPFRDMTRAVIDFKRKRIRRQEEERYQQQMEGIYTPYEDILEVNPDEVSTVFLRRIMGLPVVYEDPLDGEPGYKAKTRNKSFTERDVENYESLRDLYFWYCKMDIYQSVLGGTKLFMEYEVWSQVQPRAPIGRIDSIFGTFDHLMLLLGRMAHFASADLARKRKVGQMDRPPSAPGGGQGQSPPGFAGMIPATGKITIPSGFTPPRDTSPQSDSTGDESDLDAKTRAALQEWEALRQAFDVFRAQLGPDFEALGPELQPERQTPFGPALVYRTFSIAGIWLNYYMGLIVLQRSHPRMPPIAMVAAGMATEQTAPWANSIGRIAAGLAEGDFSTAPHVSTVVGAAFIESCFCLFVAGVQFRDDAQRTWTVQRLNDISRLTGWQSGRQIAHGCEVAWTRAAAVGRGPPYVRPEDRAPNALRGAGDLSRRIDDRLQELDSDEDRLVLARTEQTHYALGLIGTELEMAKLDLQDRG